MKKCHPLLNINFVQGEKDGRKDIERNTFG